MQKFYDQVAVELKEGMVKDGLWARAMAETGTDDGRAKAFYIKIRAKELADIETAKVEAVAKRLADEKKIIAKRAEEEKERLDSENGIDTANAGKSLAIILSITFLLIFVVVVIGSIGNRH